MKLIVREGGETREIELAQDGRSVRASVGDADYELDVSGPEPGIFLVKNGSRILEATVIPSSVKGTYSVVIGDDSFEIEVADPRRLRSSGAGGADADGVVEIRTQMPGKVVRILASEGDEVAAGDGVVVVEAMKMQNEMKSPKDGVIREVRCSEGATVNAGDVLVVIE